MSVSIAGGGTLTGVDLSASGFGRILQTLQTLKTDVFSTTSTSYAAVTGLSVSITPASASNKVLIIASFTFAGEGNAVDGLFARLSGGNTSSFIGDAFGNRERAAAGAVLYLQIQDQALPVTLVYLDSPATTSSVSYGVEVKNENASSTIRVGQARSVDDPAFAVIPSTITVMEIAA